MNNIEELITTIDDYGYGYESVSKQQYGETVPEQLCDMLKSFVEPMKKNEMFLDIGCGANKPGYIARCINKDIITMGFENEPGRFLYSHATKNRLSKSQFSTITENAFLREVDINIVMNLNGFHVVYSFNACMGDELREHIRKLVESSTTIRVYISNDPNIPDGFLRYKKSFLLNLTSKEKDCRAFYVYLRDIESDDKFTDLADTVPTMLASTGKRTRSQTKTNLEPVGKLACQSVDVASCDTVSIKSN